MQVKQLGHLDHLGWSPLEVLPNCRRWQQPRAACRDGWLESIFSACLHICVWELQLVNSQPADKVLLLTQIKSFQIQPSEAPLSHSFPLCLEMILETAVSNLHCDTLHPVIWASGSLNPLPSEALPQASRATSLAPLNPVSSLETSASKHTYPIPAFKFSYSTYFSSTSSKLHSYCYKYSMFTGSLLGKMSGSFVMS